MEVPKDREGIKMLMRMQAKLTMMAWQELYNQVKMDNVSVSDDEMECIEAAVLVNQEHYDNIDAFTEQLMNDQAGLSLMQAAIAPYMPDNKEDA